MAGSAAGVLGSNVVPAAVVASRLDRVCVIILHPNMVAKIAAQEITDLLLNRKLVTASHVKVKIFVKISCFLLSVSPLRAPCVCRVRTTFSPEKSLNLQTRPWKSLKL